MNDDARYDVLILDPGTRKIESVAGSRLFLNEGYYSAIVWRNTWLARLSKKEKLVEIAAHKNREIGSVLKEKDRIKPKG